MLLRNVSKRVSCDASMTSIALFIVTAIEIFDSVLGFQFLKGGRDRVFYVCLAVCNTATLQK